VSDESDDDELYEIDYIESHKTSKDGKRVEFRVRWKGYGSD
jgi:hypothetical protein